MYVKIPLNSCECGLESIGIMRGAFQNRKLSDDVGCRKSLIKLNRFLCMPRAKARRFTEKEDRQAKHIASSEKKRGKSAKVAKRIGYATVNKNKKS